MPLSNPRISRSAGTLNKAQIRNSVVTVMGRPASICCQWRAENPSEIISSCVYPAPSRSFFTRCPKARKNLAWLTTPFYVMAHEQKHHEQISCMIGHTGTQGLLGVNKKNLQSTARQPVATGSIINRVWTIVVIFEERS
jgi:hypothetical protein